jgi:hypothetical protein
MPPPAVSTHSSSGEVRFVPAGWLVGALGVARFVVSRGKFGKLGIAALLWAVTPRKLKLIAAGFVAAAMLVVLGSLAAIVLLAMQLG